MRANLAQKRRSHAAADCIGGFQVGGGVPGELTAVSENCLQIAFLQRFRRYAVPLKRAISLHAGDLVEIRVRCKSGTDLSGRFSCGFQSGLILAADRSITSAAGLSAVLTLQGNTVLTEFYLTKSNTGNYTPAEPCRCQITLVANGEELF